MIDNCQIIKKDIEWLFMETAGFLEKSLIINSTV